MIGESWWEIKKNNEGGLRFAEKIRHKKNRMFWWKKKKKIKKKIQKKKKRKFKKKKKKKKKKLILESIAGFPFSQYFVRYFAFRVN